MDKERDKNRDHDDYESLDVEVRPIEFIWEPRIARFKCRNIKGHSFDRKQAISIENYLDEIQSNRWVVLYHKGHCCVAMMIMATGLALFFTIILPILLIGVGVYILMQKTKYYEFVFQKMLVSFGNIEAMNKRDLRQCGIESRLLYNKSKFLGGFCWFFGWVSDLVGLCFLAIFLAFFLFSYLAFGRFLDFC